MVYYKSMDYGNTTVLKPSLHSIIRVYTWWLPLTDNKACLHGKTMHSGKRKPSAYLKWL